MNLKELIKNKWFLAGASAVGFVVIVVTSLIFLAPDVLNNLWGSDLTGDNNAPSSSKTTIGSENDQDQVDAASSTTTIAATVTTTNASQTTTTKKGATVADTTKPSVQITNPTNGSTLLSAGNGSSSVSINASASDNVGVSRVEFYINGALKGTDTSAPYLYVWTYGYESAGSKSLVAKAYDTAGNVTTSSTVVVNILR